MARFIITSGTEYDPLSYDEMMKPVSEANTAYNSALDSYETLNADAATLKNYISDNDEDKKAKTMYDDYMTLLNNLQNDVYENGITSSTRKNLANVRNAYASDIARIQTAVSKRQEASKAYHDALDKDATLVVGKDPGTEGLDAYLDNDTYGRDYYRYSGATLADEVLSDAKNRASEFTREAQYNDSVVPGYIQKIEQSGYTSDEVEKAFDAVSAAISNDAPRDYNGLDDASRILAEVLDSNIQKTGAIEAFKSGKITEQDFNRLLGYAKEGISGAIGEQKVSELQNRDITTTSGSGSHSGSNKKPAKDAVQDSMYNTFVDKQYTRNAKNLKSNYAAYANGAKPITTDTGAVVAVSSPFVMTDYVLNSPERDHYRTTFGIDIMLDKTQEGVYTDAYGHDQKCTYKKMKDIDVDNLKKAGYPGAVYALYDETGKMMMDETISLINDRQADAGYRQAYQQNNQNINWEKDFGVISPEQERKLREENHIDPRVPLAALETVINTKYRTGDRVSVTIIGNENHYKNARESVANNLISSYTGNNAAGTVSTTSENGIYAIQKGGNELSEKAETDLKKILGDDRKPISISSVFMYPEDLTAGKNGGTVVRFTNVNSDDKVYACSPKLMGSFVYNALEAPAYVSTSGQEITVADGGRLMMDLFNNPDKIARMSEKEVLAWTEMTSSLLANAIRRDADGNETNALVSNGLFVEKDGKVVVPDALTILKNPELQNRLYNAISDYLQIHLQVAADTKVENGKA